MTRTLTGYNFLNITPNELILFAFCSYWKILAAQPRWDFSLLPRISGNFQKCSWYFLIAIWFTFRRWSLSWRHPGGVWSSSALRQATTTFLWFHFNICDFLTWIKWLILAFKQLLIYLHSVKCWTIVMLDLQNSWN